MGHQELVADLQKKGDARKQEIWQKAQDKINVMKANASQKIAAEKKNLADEETAACEKIRTSIIMNAQREVNAVLNGAEQGLAKRLYSLAQDVVPELKDLRRYETIFTALAAELPPYSWDETVVHPDDIKMAATTFPGIQIVVDKKIGGGFKIIGRNQTIIVDNTFEKRLERIWPMLLPQLIENIKEILAKDEAIT